MGERSKQHGEGSRNIVITTRGIGGARDDGRSLGEGYERVITVTHATLTALCLSSDRSTAFRGQGGREFPRLRLSKAASTWRGREGLGACLASVLGERWGLQISTR